MPDRLPARRPEKNSTRWEKLGCRSGQFSPQAGSFRRSYWPAALTESGSPGRFQPGTTLFTRYPFLCGEGSGKHNRRRGRIRDGCHGKGPLCPHVAASVSFSVPRFTPPCPALVAVSTKAMMAARIGSESSGQASMIRFNSGLRSGFSLVKARSRRLLSLLEKSAELEFRSVVKSDFGSSDDRFPKPRVAGSNPAGRIFLQAVATIAAPLCSPRVQNPFR